MQHESCISSSRLQWCWWLFDDDIFKMCLAESLCWWPGSWPLSESLSSCRRLFQRTKMLNVPVNNRSPISQSGRQHLKSAINKNRLQHLSPTLIKPKLLEISKLTKQYLGWISINLDQLGRFITGHFRWFRTNFPMDFMSRGHQVIPNGSFSSFDSERLHFHFFQSSIFLSFLLSPKMKSSVFWPHVSLASSMIHHPSDCFLAFWIRKVRFFIFFQY